jgi:SAM-dependent methyltransferase
MSDVNTQDSQSQNAVVAGYQSGRLLQTILAALKQTGADPERLRPDDLKPVDEFHTGGIVATEHLLDRAGFPKGARIADLGCGLGGTARLMATRFGAQVTGVDLTPEFVAVATELSRRVGLEGLTTFLTGSVTDLPLETAGFDHATMIHVGMNVADKSAIMAEAARILRPGGRFAIFEVMKGDNDAPLDFPVPWARAAQTSHLAAPEDYRCAAREAGLSLIEEEDRTTFALAFFDRIFSTLAKQGPPPLGVHLVMGEDARDKMTNYVANTRVGRMRAAQMIFEKVSVA